jgi:hypothetical protein
MGTDATHANAGSPSPLSHRDESLSVLYDIILPGSASGWPSASCALTDFMLAISNLSADEQSIVFHWAGVLVDRPQEDRSCLLHACQEADRDLFDRLLRQLYWSYYSSPAARRVLLQIAEAGPREDSPYVDPQLVAGVLANGRGKRRL